MCPCVFQNIFSSLVSFCCSFYIHPQQYHLFAFTHQSLVMFLTFFAFLYDLSIYLHALRCTASLLSGRCFHLLTSCSSALLRYSFTSSVKCFPSFASLYVSKMFPSVCLMLVSIPPLSALHPFTSLCAIYCFVYHCFCSLASCCDTFPYYYRTLFINLVMCIYVSLVSLWYFFLHFSLCSHLILYIFPFFVTCKRPFSCIGVVVVGIMRY